MTRRWVFHLQLGLGRAFPCLTQRILEEFRIHRVLSLQSEGPAPQFVAFANELLFGSLKMNMAATAITRTDRDQGKLSIADRRNCIYRGLRSPATRNCPTASCGSGRVIFLLSPDQSAPPP